MFTNKFSKIPHYYNLLSTFILYPYPLTVICDFGFEGVISIFSRMRRIWASSEFPYPNGTVNSISENNPVQTLEKVSNNLTIQDGKYILNNRCQKDLITNNIWGIVMNI